MLTTNFCTMPSASVLAGELPLAEEIDRTYRPEIECRRIGGGRSLFGRRIEKWEIHGEDPVNHTQRAVNVSVYRPRKGAEKGAIIILPPTGGVNILDRGYANELCSSGFSVALVSDWKHQDEITMDFSMHDHGALRAIAAVRHVVEFLRAERNHPVGLLGTSIGAIAGALAIHFEPNISSAALIVGSARFADVIAESDEAGATTLRAERMRALGLDTLDDYKKAVRQGVRIEPSAFINRVGKKRTLVVSAGDDTTVPSSFQWELAELLESEVHIKIDGNHLAAIKGSFCSHRKRIVAFFEDTLNV